MCTQDCYYCENDLFHPSEYSDSDSEREYYNRNYEEENCDPYYGDYEYEEDIQTMFLKERETATEVETYELPEIIVCETIPEFFAVRGINEEFVLFELYVHAPYHATYIDYAFSADSVCVNRDNCEHVNELIQYAYTEIANDRKFVGTLTFQRLIGDICSRHGVEMQTWLIGPKSCN